jgi:hypothetical protein
VTPKSDIHQPGAIYQNPFICIFEIQAGLLSLPITGSCVRLSFHVGRDALAVLSTVFVVYITFEGVKFIHISEENNVFIFSVEQYQAASKGPAS